VVCDLDDELVAITDGLKAKGWANTDDFRFKKYTAEGPGPVPAISIVFSFILLL
jgi:hypothetical protein